MVKILIWISIYENNVQIGFELLKIIHGRQDQDRTSRILDWHLLLVKYICDLKFQQGKAR